MVKDLKIRQSGLVEGIFLINRCDFKPFSSKPGTFLSCDLTDRTGTIKAVMWDNTAPLKAWLKNKMVVKVYGELSNYKDSLQIVLKTISRTEDYNKADIVPSLDPDKIQEVMKGLDKYKETIKDAICKKVWKETLTTLRAPYSQCPGGIGEVHHSYIGGLAEHSYGMMKISEGLCNGLDRDIVLTGCLVHDLGKIRCYNWDAVLEMTDAGRLLHHTSIGYGLLLEIIPDHDSETFLKLAHIIIAHHEEEGIRKTMLPEATAVANLDALDAVLNHSVGFTGKAENIDPGTNWTKFCSLTSRQYYNPPKKEKPLDMNSILDDIL
jgi:3'-5' exoribonuclease